MSTPAKKVELAERTEENQEAYDEALSKARTGSLSELRVKYRDEFNTGITQAMEKAGFSWKPRPTKEERAEQQLEKLLAENPSLRQKLSTPPTAG